MKIVIMKGHKVIGIQRVVTREIYLFSHLSEKKSSMLGLPRTHARHGYEGELAMI